MTCIVVCYSVSIRGNWNGIDCQCAGMEGCFNVNHHSVTLTHWRVAALLEITVFFIQLYSKRVFQTKQEAEGLYGKAGELERQLVNQGEMNNTMKNVTLSCRRSNELYVIKCMSKVMWKIQRNLITKYFADKILSVLSNIGLAYIGLCRMEHIV